jgi:hypothetical protein
LPVKAREEESGALGLFYSTVTLLARFLGWSTSLPMTTAV